MSLKIEWDHVARASFERVPWPASSDLARALYFFAEEKASSLASGRYAVRTTQYEAAVRLDQETSSMLVLHVYARR